MIVINKKKFIEIVPTYPLPIPIYEKEDYFTWPAKLMKRNGYKVEIFTLGKRGQKRTEIIKGFTVKRFITPLHLYFNLIKEKEATVYSQGKLFPLFAGIFTRRAVYNPHGSFGRTLPKYLKIPLLRFIWKQLFRRFHKVTALTDFEFNTYIKLGFANNIVQIPNLIDFEYFSKRTNDKYFLTKYDKKISRFIVFVGNIHGNVKNIQVLISAFKLVNKKIKKSKLVIIGKIIDNDQSASNLINESNKNKNIILTGWLNHKEIRNFLSVASVFVNSSTNEGQSIAVGEAAAAGVSLCLSKIGVFQETYGETALYHNPNDYETLAKNILYYLNNVEVATKDAEINQLYARNNFHPSIIMEKMKHLLADDKKEMKVVENEWLTHWDKSSIEYEFKQIYYESHYTDTFNKLFKKGDRVLEAGCGFGRYCFWLSLRGLKSYGIDIVEKAIIEGKNYAKKNNFINVNLQKGDICKLPYRNNYFNGYISLGVVEHFKNVKDIERAFKEAYRVLKSGGYAYFSIPNPYALHMWPEKILKLFNINNGITHYLLTKNDILRYSRKVKFNIISSGYHDFYFPIYNILTTFLGRDVWILKSFLKETLNLFDSLSVLSNFGSGIHVILQKPL